jgi:uncharacterized membrane protein YjdF
MKKYSLIFISFWLMLLLAGLHFLAITYYFYWTISWFDNLMHFLGGLTGGFFAVWFFFDSGLVFNIEPTRRQAVYAALISVMIVGVVWEIFEYRFGVTGFEGLPGYEFDTTLDLIFDALGAIVAGIIGSRKIFRIKESHV